MPLGGIGGARGLLRHGGGDGVLLSWHRAPRQLSSLGWCLEASSGLPTQQLFVSP